MRKRKNFVLFNGQIIHCPPLPPPKKVIMMIIKYSADGCVLSGRQDCSVAEEFFSQILLSGKKRYFLRKPRIVLGKSNKVSLLDRTRCENRHRFCFVSNSYTSSGKTYVNGNLEIFLAKSFKVRFLHGKECRNR